MGRRKHICHQKRSLSEGAGEVMNEPFITEASSLLTFPLRRKHLPCYLPAAVPLPACHL